MPNYYLAMSDEDLPRPLSIVPPPDPDLLPGAVRSLYPGQGEGATAATARPPRASGAASSAGRTGGASPPLTDPAPQGPAAEGGNSARPDTGAVPSAVSARPARPSGASDGPAVRTNRRHSADPYVQLPGAFSIVGALLALAAAVLAERATTNNHGVDSFFGMTRHRFYEPQYYHYAATALGASLLLSLAGLWMNGQRMRRKGDHYSRPLIALAGASALGLGRYLMWLSG